MADETVTQEETVQQRAEQTLVEVLKETDQGNASKPDETPVETPEQQEAEKVTNEQISEAQSGRDKRADLLKKLQTESSGFDTKIESLIAQTTVGQTSTALPEQKADKPDTGASDDLEDVVTRGDLADLRKDIIDLVSGAVEAPQRQQALASVFDYMNALKEHGTFSDENREEVKTMLASLDPKTTWPEAAKVMKRMIKGIASENILNGQNFKVVDAREGKAQEIKNTTQPASASVPAPAKETDEDILLRQLDEAGGNKDVMKRLFHARPN